MVPPTRLVRALAAKVRALRLAAWVLFIVGAIVVGLGTSTAAIEMHGAGTGYDLPTHMYDGTDQSADARTGEEVPLAPEVASEGTRGAVVLARGVSSVLLLNSVAANTADSLPSVIYREGTPRPGNLTPRPVDDGALSFRDTLSNPIGSAERPVFRPGEPYIGIDPSRLPPGSVVVDGVPPGHVSVRGVTVDEFLGALVERGRLPK